MKFSVLLPTRNGGRFLRNCIGSVLEQPYPDMELVVSDNANTDETQSVVSAFRSDSRLKYIRLNEPVSVTENWNVALQESQGEYFLMIGDDDYLLPGYFDRMAQVIERYHHPDGIVYNAYSYVFPSSIDGNRSSYYADPHFRFGPGFADGFLPPDFRKAIVRDMFRFRVRYPLNMQLTLVSRRAADRIRGGPFQPPFPDHYALNALLLDAQTVVYCPEKLVVVGVSPKSFGHFAYSNKQDKGMRYLGSDSAFEGRLPGNELVNSMYLWLVRLQANYSDQLGKIRISRADYVRRQAYAWCGQLQSGHTTTGQALAQFARLSPGDWASLILSVFDSVSLTYLARAVRSRSRDRIQAKWHGLQVLGSINDIKEFAAWILTDVQFVAAGHAQNPGIVSLVDAPSTSAAGSLTKRGTSA